MLTILDYFIDARLPALDGYLSGPHQSLLLELAFWLSLFLVYFSVGSELLRSILRTKEFWHANSLKTKAGIFCWNAQDDVILLTLLGIHHGSAGLMCALGVMNNDANMWRHGYLWEVAFELGDLISMLVRLYPYKLDNVKMDAQIGMIFHHLAGVFFSALILEAGLHHNGHVREIAFWLLVGASVSCWVAIRQAFLCLTTQILQATMVYAFGVAFFCYCRLYVLPTESYLVMQDVNADPELAGTWFATLLPVYFWLLTVFNLLILADAIPKLIRHFQRLGDGVTVIENVKVPLSREDSMQPALVPLADESEASESSSEENCGVAVEAKKLK